MMNIRLFSWLPIFVFLSVSCQKKVLTETFPSTKIAFGSCASQDHPLPIFDVINGYKPEYFIFLGDNIYGDSYVMDTLRSKYKRLSNHKNYQTLAAQSKIYATWDDHDYGENDGGKSYRYKKESKEIFLDFFKEPAASSRRQHNGIYHAEYINIAGKTLQIILLDNRTFRDDLLPYAGYVKNDPRYFYELDYNPHVDPTKTLLGAEQWAWLEIELSKKADLRLICSGSQFSIEYNGYEAWANFPHEQKRMLELIKSTKANGVLFLTGDVHYAELSKLNYPGLYPIYDVTASGLSSKWDFATPNVNRIKGPVMDNHFGMLEIEWSNPIKIKAKVIDDKNKERFSMNLDTDMLKVQP
jgi:alkaline phosphatase D